MTRGLSTSFLRVFAGLAGSLLITCGGPLVGPDMTGVAPESTSGTVHLTAAEVQTIIAQAASQAQAMGRPMTIAVVDHEGTVLGVFRMTGAADNTTFQGGGSGGLDGSTVPANLAAISKAGTAAFFSTQGNAFTTRSASFIVQEHFPPQVNPSPGGPLFGVQFSQLRCSDVSRTGHPSATDNLPLGLSADPGGLPLYKNGTAVGGIGVEGDGVYTRDPDSSDDDQSIEELVALAGTIGFAAPTGIRADQIFIDGIRIPFANAEPPAGLSTIQYVSLSGTPLLAPIDSPSTGFNPATVGGVLGTVDSGFATPPLNAADPPTFTSSLAAGGLTADEVYQTIAQAAQQSVITRAAIRNPLGSRARVSIAVVDVDGSILGLFRTLDAPIFGFDVAVQKARTANFFSSPSAAGDLTALGQSTYVSAANADRLSLNGSIAYSDRADGFLSQPIYPPGAYSNFSNGPYSKPLGTWSIFNTGLQLDLAQTQLVASLTGPVAQCTTAPSKINNGIQIFPGSVPLYKNGVLVGAIGISGDGVDQDDLIAYAGSVGFQAPPEIRSDTVTVRGTPLPWQVFPRHPNL
ncbi:MAG: hypothetical protein RL768_1507 [Nitrospirota bacterium]|jgi:uncharacterized protein GlcG (DUF336 family)